MNGGITMTTSKTYLETKRQYHRIHQDVLDGMPRDIVQEMARRRLQELETIDKKNTGGQGECAPAVHVNT